jgi:hypothetical protein
VSPVKYELGFYIPEDGVLHSHCRETVKSYNIFCPNGPMGLATTEVRIRLNVPDHAP